MSNNGWIQLHRQIRENWIWSDPEKLRAWLDIILEVNHEEHQVPIGNHIITVKRGQKHTSVRKMADRWGWSRDRVCRFLDLLCEAGMLTSTRTQIGTLLTVVNYDVFQTPPDTNKATYKDTNKATNKATDKATHKAQTTNNNNDNNDNNANNFFCAGALKKIPPEKSDVEAYCREKRYHGMDIDGFFEYYDMRDWKLTGGLKMPDWTKAVDYWHSKGKKDAEKGQSDAPYLEEFETAPVVVGSEVPFKGGLAAEMIRRKRAKNG